MPTSAAKRASRKAAVASGVNDHDRTATFDLFDVVLVAVACPCFLPAASEWAKTWAPRTSLARAA